jgi:hypothetical protein
MTACGPRTPDVGRMAWCAEPGPGQPGHVLFPGGIGRKQ